jgi:hypothetical protein
VSKQKMGLNTGDIFYNKKSQGVRFFKNKSKSEAAAINKI